MRSWALAVLAAVLFAAPAAAQTPAPTVFSFDDADPLWLYPPTLVAHAPRCDLPISLNYPTGPHSAPSSLFAPCLPTLRLTFDVPQLSVELFARTPNGSATELVVTAHTVTGPVTVTVPDPDPETWKPVVVAGLGPIDYVDLRAPGADIGVDDLAISPSPQPDTSVVTGPPARTESRQATFTFGANRPDIAGWHCALDDAALAPCTSPVTYEGLAERPHTFRVAAVDAYGAVDPSPAEHSWTVLGPPPDTAIDTGTTPAVSGGTVTLDFPPPGPGVAGYECSLDGGAFSACTPPFVATGLAPGQHMIDVRAVDADGRPDPTPQRWTFDVPAQRSIIGTPFTETDLDRDRIPDSQEILPLGNVPPVAGVRTLAALISGTVYVKLPSRTLLQSRLPGFVPLKGTAALPVGTIVDARRGRLSLQAAADGRPLGDPRRRVGRSTLADAIFQIRQARLRRPALKARPIATSLVLASDPTASIGCRKQPPAKGAVRTLAATASEGLFRVSGGASRAESRNAAWRTTDRCTGTVTTVTRGVLRLYDKVRKRNVLVRAGSRYVARVRLFQGPEGMASAVEDVGDVGVADALRLAEQPDRLAVRLGLALEHLAHVRVARVVVLQKHPALLIAAGIDHGLDERAPDRARAPQHPPALEVLLEPGEAAGHDVGTGEDGARVRRELHVAQDGSRVGVQLA
jgi:hypothetical protein